MEPVLTEIANIIIAAIRVADGVRQFVDLTPEEITLYVTAVVSLLSLLVRALRLLFKKTVGQCPHTLSKRRFTASEVRTAM